jgi:hypothetical protein
VTAFLVAVVVTMACAVPIAISAWALLDAARRPQWAWALTGHRQVVWMAAILFGTLILVAGLIVSSLYLRRIRPVIANAENGLIGGLSDR